MLAGLALVPGSQGFHSPMYLVSATWCSHRDVFQWAGEIEDGSGGHRAVIPIPSQILTGTPRRLELSSATSEPPVKRTSMVVDGPGHSLWYFTQGTACDSQE